MAVVTNKAIASVPKARDRMYFIHEIISHQAENSLKLLKL
jgi:hypothetical protein